MKITQSSFSWVVRSVAAFLAVGFGIAAGLHSGAVLSEAISRPLAPTILGAWTYTSPGDGSFAAFTDGNHAVVESRWQGPESLSLKRNIFPFPVPLARPAGTVRRYDFSGAISPNRKLFATETRGAVAGSWRVYVWNLAHGHISPAVMPGRAQPPRSGDLAFSPDSRLVASIGWVPHSRQMAVVLHEAESGKVYRRLPLPRQVRSGYSVRSVVFTSNNTLACALCGNFVTLMRWNVASGQVLYSGRLNQVTDVGAMASFAGGHELVLSGSAPHRMDRPMVAILDVATGRPIKLIRVDKDAGWTRRKMQGQYLSHICVTGDGRYAVATEFGLPDSEGLGNSSAGRFVIVDVKLRRIVYRSATISAEALWYVDVSPDGRRLLIAGNTRVYLLPAPFRL